MVSRYDFEVQHIKGKTNLIPDFLLRVSKLVSRVSSIIKITYPFVGMAYFLQGTPHPQMPQGLSSQERDMWIYRKIIELYPQVLPHPNDFSAPFPSRLFPTINESFPHTDNEFWYLWCLTTLYHLPVEIPLLPTLWFLHREENHRHPAWQFFQLFENISSWQYKLKAWIHQDNLFTHPDFTKAKKYMAILFLRRQYDSSGTIVTTITHWKNLPCRFEESSLHIKNALLIHGNSLNNSTNLYIPMVSMHRQDTDPRRMFSYADLTPGPSTEPGPSQGPPGPLGLEFQDSQPPDTPMTSQ
ncbi:hypothetical protein JCGZ_06736 [Jatropha curcas]|uniref:Uncharacterized protein n=1 Tax=Jatropha curcas TaxID=180498 RepID=A0A067J9B9_JATCU|nr:hypothetical protein JCGZ_06736 [Jatropha curcas]